MFHCGVRTMLFFSLCSQIIVLANNFTLSRLSPVPPPHNSSLLASGPKKTKKKPRTFLFPTVIILKSWSHHACPLDSVVAQRVWKKSSMCVVWYGGLPPLLLRLQVCKPPKQVALHFISCRLRAIIILFLGISQRLM